MYAGNNPNLDFNMFRFGLLIPATRTTSSLCPFEENLSLREDASKDQQQQLDTIHNPKKNFPALAK